MKGHIDVTALSVDDAVSARPNYVWMPGVYVIMDDRSAIFETRAELDAFIRELQEKAAEQWP